MAKNICFVRARADSLEMENKHFDGENKKTTVLELPGGLGGWGDFQKLLKGPNSHSWQHPCRQCRPEGEILRPNI